MKALILCAGLGTRLRPLTEQLPKSLFPILGTPLLELIVSHLRDGGVEKIAVNTHHFPQAIKTFLAHQSHFSSQISISHEQEILGTGGAIGQLKYFFQDENCFILYNGDILTNLELKPVLKKHLEERPLITMILHHYPPANNVIINQERDIIDLRGVLGVSPESPNQCLAYTGISIVSRELVEYCPDKSFADLIEILLNIILSKRGKIRGFIVNNHYWQDIGTIEDYYRVHRDILLGKKAAFKGLPSLSAAIYQGKGTIIEAGVTMKGFCSIGSNCLIRKGAQLENCIIWDHTEVEENEHLKDCIRSREIIYHVNP
ncbi:MAG: NDP-sugar synthase, partial [Proteobacteria bacterium]|nr:NDP-sugar synthase [Pseudomonadota bacterium]